MERHVPRQEATEPPTEAGREAMAGLRAIWSATGQLQDESLGLDCAADERGCGSSLGFDALAEGEPAADRSENLDRLRGAWKTTLAKEGKLRDPEQLAPPAPPRRGA